MRSLLFRFPDAAAFEQLVEPMRAGDLEIAAPAGSPGLDDGEWILAVFEVGPHRRATSTAARASVGPDGTRVLVEPRDCRRLGEFARIQAGRPAAAPKAEGAALEASDVAPRTERSASAPPPATTPVPPPATTPTPPPRGAFPSGAGSRVLVVDDDDTIRDMVAAMLEAVGLVVTTAGSAEEALALFREGTFELVVLDWHMPRMTGLELCRTLRARPALAALPVLFLTANTSSSDMVEAFAAGADDYVVKPFRAPELGARIFSLLRRARLAGAAG